MEDADIKKATPQVFKVVLVFKLNNSQDICTCVDMQQPNKAIGWERHISPTIDDVISEFAYAKLFSNQNLIRAIIN